MRISVDWLRQYLDFDLSIDELSQALTSLGLEVEGVEAFEQVKGNLQGIVVGQVKTCWKHPNADRLRITTVDVGIGQDLQIVCGAPNVAEGQKVLVAMEGATLYPTSSEPFTIKKGKIRGENSEGMICAEDEVGLGSSHDGIKILAEDARVGIPVAEYFGFKEDTVLEIGLTPNRADATNHIGVAKDLSAWLQVQQQKKSSVNLPQGKTLTTEADTLAITVDVKDTNACPRYSGVCFSNIKIADSPTWLQDRLLAVGQKPINNIVDVTNYVLFEFGQALHAFDYDKIIGHHIHVQQLAADTPFHSLDGNTIKLHAQDLMICDGEQKPMCMAGVYGGKDSGVSETTTRIFLESAHFEAKTIRNASMRHILRTNAAKCFEKGSDPNITVTALERAAYLLQEVAGAKIASELIDLYPKKIHPSEISLSLLKLNQISGIQFNENSFKQVVFALGMELTDQRNGTYLITVPTNKPDVLRDVDVIEEILRVYGLDHVQMPDYIKSTFSSGMHSAYPLKKKISDLLCGEGLMEIMGLSVCSSEQCLRTGAFEMSNLALIHNTSNTNLDALRPALWITALESIQHNQNRQQSNLKLFEWGKAYQRSETSYIEQEFLGIWLTGMMTEEHWSNTKPVEVNYFDLKSIVENLFQKLGNTRLLDWRNLEASKVFEFGQEIVLNGNVVVRIGKMPAKTTQSFDIKKAVYYAEFDWVGLQSFNAATNRQYSPISKFPAVRRDLAMTIQKNVPFSDLQKAAFKTVGSELKQCGLFDIYENEEQLGKGNISYALSFVFEAGEKQLESGQLDAYMQQLIKVYEKDFSAKIRK